MMSYSSRCTARRLGAALTAFALAVGCAYPHAAANTGGTVFLSTVPAEPGVTLDVGGATVTTGTDGSATVQAADLNGIASRIRLASGRAGNGQGVSISKVLSGLHLKHESHLSIGLDVTSTVTLKLQQGSTQVSPSSVHLLRLHSITGKVRKIDPQKQQQVSLLARRTRLIHGQLTPQTVTWSVDRVAVAPGVAVTTANGRFDPGRNSTWVLALQPIKGEVVIHTAPSTPGVVFLLDGATMTTGPAGNVTAPIDDLNNVSDRLQLASANASGLLVSNLRVSKLPPRKVRQRVVTAALDVRRLVVLRFVDLKGAPIPASRIAEVSLSSGNALVSRVGSQLDDPAALLTQVAAKAGGGWQTRKVVYSLRSVKLDGGQAVFNGRQRFQPSDGATWNISLAVFSLTMTAHDALFGYQIRSRVVITRPSGAHYAVELSKVKSAVSKSMVRGLYGLTVDSALVGGQTSVLVSRDDKVDLRVVTLLDSVVMIVVILIILLSAVLGGRVLARRRTSNRAARL